MRLCSKAGWLESYYTKLDRSLPADPFSIWIQVTAGEPLWEGYHKENSVQKSKNSWIQQILYFFQWTRKHLGAWNVAPIVSLCVSTHSAREGLLAGRRRGVSGGDAELRMSGMSSPVYSPGRFTPAGQGAITSPGPSSPFCPPHYKRVKLRGDLIRSSLHHRQSPLACQAGLLIH